MDDLLGIRELFREEARTILDRLRVRLPEIERQLPDERGLADVVADGVALKGSGALVGLPVVSRAGVLIVRVAELAAERAGDDVAGATKTIGALHASLGALDHLLDACLDRDDGAQDVLLADVLGHFSPSDRSLLLGVIEGDTAPGRPAAEAIRTEALDALAATMTDLLIANTQLGGLEVEIEAAAAAVDRHDGPATPAAPVRRLIATVAAREAPARALVRAAGELHRRLREIGLPSASLESLVVLHAGDNRYALAADDVQAVVPAVGASPTEGAGRSALSLDGAMLPALDLAACLGADVEPAGSAATAVIVEAAGSRFALLVVRAEVPRLMVTRPLDPLLATHPLLRNVTVGSRGEVVFVLRSEALLAALQGRIAVPGESAPAHAPQ